ncbi:MAG: hypothetical protein LBC74_12075, partial [Planctomycetaceae bacterium]|nr:hypothetical protein [Planctomycetaceae bacterium]
MKLKFILFILLMCYSLELFCVAQNTEDNTEVKDFEEFQKTMSLAHEIWQEIRPQPNTIFAEWKLIRRDLVAKVNELKKRRKITDDVAVPIVISRFDSLMLFSGSSDIINLFQDAFSISIVSDWIDIVGSVARNKQFWVTMNENKVTFLPLETFSDIIYKKDIEILIEWERYPFPSRSILQESLDVTFEKVGLYDLAWRVQMEAGRRGYCYYISRKEMEDHSYYLTAANRAYRAGNQKLGWSFLTNAAVFENKKSFNKAMELAKIWIDVEAGKIKLPEQKILVGQERKDAFLLIVRMYQK